MRTFNFSRALELTTTFGTTRNFFKGLSSDQFGTLSSTDSSLKELSPSVTTSSYENLLFYLNGPTQMILITLPTQSLAWLMIKSITSVLI